MRRLLVALAAPVLALALPLASAAPAVAEEPVVLTIGINEDIDSANPFSLGFSLALG